MGRGRMPGWRGLVYGAVLFALGGLLLGGAFILSGIYNVAASSSHFDITNAVIRTTLRRSVVTRSLGIEPPDLSNEGLARLGARHFELGCAPCHGSPASAQNPVVAEMYPAPPALSHAAEDWETDELFWIVKHGLKFTGMPSWPALGRDDEVWALVAFLERLPESDAEDYAALAGLESEQNASSLEFGQDAAADTVAMCENCHGDAENAPVHPLVPALEGQKEGYLWRALTEYASRRRPSGIMEPIAAALGPAEIERLAGLYAEAPGARESPAEADAEAIRRGQAIAQNGVREDDIPACNACHAAGTSGNFPRLGGLSQEYISTQLSLFRHGIREGSTYSAIMKPIAQRLSDQQIEDVAAYFASRAAGRAANWPTASEVAR